MASYSSALKRPAPDCLAVGTRAWSAPHQRVAKTKSIAHCGASGVPSTRIRNEISGSTAYPAVLRPKRWDTMLPDTDLDRFRKPRERGIP